MVTQLSPDTVLEALRQQFRARLNEISAEEISAAHERIEKRILSEVDQIALRLLNHYDVYNRQDQLVITVKKLTGER